MGLEKEAEVGKDGKPVQYYFFTKHTMEDLDCFVDLKNLESNNVRRAMRFSEDDLLYAGNMKFLRNMKGCTFLAGKRTIYEVPGWIAEKATLVDYMKKEGW